MKTVILGAGISGIGAGYQLNKNNKVILFEKGCKSIEHIPNPASYYNQIWLKHPAQNNLYPLTTEEKERILNSFKERENKNIDKIKNYEEWLKVQYGNYLAKDLDIRLNHEVKEIDTQNKIIYFTNI